MSAPNPLGVGERECERAADREPGRVITGGRPHRPPLQDRTANGPIGGEGVGNDAGLELSALRARSELVPSLFHAASVLSFPSLEEGFGLVALEALASGLPLLTSARAPLTEFLDASVATLVDPTSERAITAGLLAALAASPERVAAGRRLAAVHSWDRVAAPHLNAYHSLAGARAAGRPSLDTTATLHT